jgi:hypothetical protein
MSGYRRGQPKDNQGRKCGGADRFSGAVRNRAGTLCAVNHATRSYTVGTAMGGTAMGSRQESGISARTVTGSVPAACDNDAPTCSARTPGDERGASVPPGFSAGFTGRTAGLPHEIPDS